MGFKKHISTLRKQIPNVESKEHVVINDRNVLSNCEEKKDKMNIGKRVSFKHPKYTSTHIMVVMV